MDCSFNSTMLPSNTNAYRCVVLNEAAQHLIKESVSMVDNEIAMLRKEVTSLLISTIF